MALPKKKKSKSKTRMRRAKHDRIALVKLVECPQCGEYMRPHRVCPHCGYYREREVVTRGEE